jgi:cyclophilin family peptidyl-prolyl cis-trans isomerase
VIPPPPPPPPSEIPPVVPAPVRSSRRAAAIAGAFVVVAGIVVGVVVIAGNSDKKSPSTTSVGIVAPPTGSGALPAGCVSTKPPVAVPGTYAEAPAMTVDPAKTYTATMTTSCGAITIALDPKEAPKTVNSFVFLARHHFYDGLLFHRVVPNFVVQGGDPKGDGTGGPGYTLPDEPPATGYKAGSVAMANAGSGTTGSQFFLVSTANGAAGLGGPPYLYSILGQITKGLDVVTKMNTLAPASGDGPPVHPLYIFKVSISES